MLCLCSLFCGYRFGNSWILDIISDILFFPCCYQCPSCSNKCTGLCNLLYWCFKVIFSRKYHLIILFPFFAVSFLNCSTSFFQHKCYWTWGFSFFGLNVFNTGLPYLFLCILSSSDAALAYVKLIQHLAVFRGYKGQIESLSNI